MDNSFTVFEYNLKDEIYKSEDFYHNIIHQSEFILNFSNGFLKRNKVNILLSSATINNIQAIMDYKICCFIKDNCNFDTSDFDIQQSTNSDLKSISEMNNFSKDFIKNFLQKIKWQGEVIIFGHDLDPFYIIKIE